MEQLRLRHGRLWIDAGCRFFPVPVKLKALGVLERIGPWTRAVESAESCVEAAAVCGHRTLQVESLLLAAKFRFRLGMLDESEMLLERAESLLTAMGNHSMLADALTHRALLAKRRGRYQEAERMYLQALSIHRKLEDRTGMSIAEENLGSILQNRGDYEGALEHYRTSLTLCEQLEDATGMAYVLLSIGNVYYYQGRLDEAASAYRRQLEIARRTGDKHIQCFALGALGNTLYDLGNLADALEKYRTSLRLCRELGDIQGAAQSLGSEGLALMALGDYPGARARFEKSLSCFEQMGDRQNQCVTLDFLGTVMKKIGDPGAGGRLAESVAIARELNLQYYLCSSLLSLAEFLWDAERYDEAATAVAEAESLATLIDRNDIAFKSRLLAALLVARTYPGKAEASLSGELGTAKGPEAKASVLYALFKATGDERYRIMAHEQYLALLAIIPRKEYRERIAELTDSRDKQRQ